MTLSTRIASSTHYRIIVLLCTLLVLCAASRTRAVEIPRPDEELRTVQCDTGAIAAVSHPFVLQSHATASYLSPLAREVHRHTSFAFSLTYRGPPAHS